MIRAKPRLYSDDSEDSEDIPAKPVMHNQLVTLSESSASSYSSSDSSSPSGESSSESDSSSPKLKAKKKQRSVAQQLVHITPSSSSDQSDKSDQPRRLTTRSATKANLKPQPNVKRLKTGPINQRETPRTRRSSDLPTPNDVFQEIKRSRAQMREDLRRLLKIHEDTVKVVDKSINFMIKTNDDLTKLRENYD